MEVTDAQLDLAIDLLWAMEQLGGPRYSEADIERVAQGIARYTWLDQQLNKCQAAQPQRKE